MKLKLTAAAALLALSAASGAHAQDPLKIGFIGELSGAQAAVGKDQLDGFMLLVERNGGKLGGVPVQIIKEDSQLKPDVANQVARRLVEREKVPIITGISFSNVMMAIHKYVTGQEVFLIGSNAGPSQIAGEQCSPYQFITSWQGDQAAEAVGKYAAEKGYKRVLVMAPNYQAGKDIVAGFKRYYKNEVVDELYTQLNQLDFAAELSQVSAAKPDAVFAFFPGGLGVAFAKQYAQAGLMKSTPLLSTFVADAITLPSIGDSAVGLVSGGFWAPDFNNPQSQRFVEEFEKKYGRIPSNYAAQSYDAAQLLDSALARVKGNVADKQAFMNALSAADFKSVRGSFKFNNNHFPIQDMHVMQVAKDGKGRLNLKTAATPLKNTQDAYHDKCPLKGAS
ncbi:amino acid/amide ABC transporter substrate-binding protein, HAAT family [Noviherbaspirillum humi]|uniref:Amino acid/amide ABC transporter substrate-binding protein, HAAT family n=1 Tax=Noviherbaspirillum humi TaxID=1688639 RepID=A0A239IRC6_9BURK|nr:ABC transporter substrate-binding protein [Noviherbaspirillum humi]SNS96095.1 amino acid/amide ABC transporter substrate-binding protein, HAAT family [Noviherbaspirillum humi]